MTRKRTIVILLHRSATNWDFSRRLLEILFKTSFKNHHLWKIKNIFKNEIIEDIEEKCIFYNYFFKVFPNECLYLSHFKIKKQELDDTCLPLHKSKQLLGKLKTRFSRFPKRLQSPLSPSISLLSSFSAVLFIMELLSQLNRNN